LSAKIELFSLSVKGLRLVMNESELILMCSKTD